jgi:thioredoxin reductase (NADPH)
MYSSRYKLKNIIIGGQPGGALATSHKVENYPGVLSAPGKEIMDNFKEHAEVSGSEVLHEMVIKLEKNEDIFEVETSTGKDFQAKKIILATGNNYRKLGFE